METDLSLISAYALSNTIRSLPGKSGKEHSVLPTWVHMADTAAVMQYLLRERTSDATYGAFAMTAEQLRKLAVFAALVHDTGKFTPLFVSRILNAVPDCKSILADNGIDLPDEYLDPHSSPHAMAGEAILEQMGIPQCLGSVIGAHHGKPAESKSAVALQMEAYGPNYYASQPDLWRSVWREWLLVALKTTGYGSVGEIPKFSFKDQMLLCGLLIEADWIASNQYFFPTVSTDGMMSFAYTEERRQTALQKLALPSFVTVPFPVDSEESFCARFGFLPNALQRTVIDIANDTACDGITVIEAQMGLGKTEAALALAESSLCKHRSGGIFFGLPTQATSNGIFPRLSEWADSVSADGTHAIRLVHGAAELNDAYTAFYRDDDSVPMEEDRESNLLAHRWYSGGKKALLADYVVGTIDTVLMAALQQKHVMLRHIGLSGKVVILDECHAYDAYMNRYLGRMLCWLGAYHVPVVLLSATLPKNRKEALLKAYLNKPKLDMLDGEDGYPLITWSDGNALHTSAVHSGKEDKHIAVRRETTDSILKILEEKMAGGGCAGIICNTVAQAQKTAMELEAAFPEKRVILCHSRFIAEDRVKIETGLEACIGKHSTPEVRDGLIVVGTQVLEQSLDIDFDLLITEICPMDLLLQRIGRLHRHTRTRPAALQEPECVVLDDEETRERATYIYHQWIIKQTGAKLPDVIAVPSDIPGLVNCVYDAVDEADADYCDWKSATETSESKASAFLLKKPVSMLSNTMHGMLTNELEGEENARASVRDGEPTVEVLVMKKADEDYAAYLTDASKLPVRTDTVPDAETAKTIARQRLRLPAALCGEETVDETIRALEAENAQVLAPWQGSAWLNGELILLMDKNCRKRLGGAKLRYDSKYGLQYEFIKGKKRGEDAND